MKSWGAAVVGLLLGLVGGLIYTWFVRPLQYVDTYPPMMSARYRQDWIRMAVWSYAQEDNWDRTQTRLLHLPTSEVAAMSAEILEHAAAQGQAAETLQRIARLATAYGATGPGIDVYADEGAGQGIAPPVGVTHPTPTAALVGRTPTTEATATPRPRPSPTAVAGTSQGAGATVEAGVPLDSFTIVSQTLSCEPEPYLAISLELSRTVEIRGREVQQQVGLPMREIWLIWDGGADRAITGLRPRKGLGYADFTVEPGRVYNLYVDSPSGRPILTLQVEPCPPSEGPGWVSRTLVLSENAVEEVATGTVVATTSLTVTVPATGTLLVPGTAAVPGAGEVSPTLTPPQSATPTVRPTR